MNTQAPHTAPTGEDGAHGARQCLSALLDGHAQGGDAQSVQRACALWRDDGPARQDWHAWSLIGDVMRSDELARPAVRDAAFLTRLRERLATEPVVLAPAPAAPVAARGRRQAWLLPAAVAAGFVAVAGVLVVARTAPPASTPTLAVAPAPGSTQPTATGALPSTAPGGAGLIRDAGLDAYLRAHQTARGATTSAVPGGGMRNVEVTLSTGAGR